MALVCHLAPANARGADCVALAPGRALASLDNDLLGGQDQGYTSGVQLVKLSPTYPAGVSGTCVTRMARWFGVPVVARQDAAVPATWNLLYSLNQAIYTPADGSRRDVVGDDRPYAALLLAGLGINRRTGDRLRSLQLQVGLVGPHAYGRQLQSAVHTITGSHRFEGWSNQLHDEPVVMLEHAGFRRFDEGHEARWRGQAVLRHAVAVGNLRTFASGGLEWRWGRELPDDFGDLPLRPSGMNVSPGPSVLPATPDTPAIRIFLGGDVAWVGRDITLDGNSFRDSHAVPRRSFMAYLGYGLAMNQGRWRLVVSRIHASREFDGQPDPPVFGNLSISRDL